MADTVDDTLVQAVLAMHPWVQRHPPAERFGVALRALLAAESCRRGAPDPVTGALHLSALTQGALLKGEFDLSVHAHVGWTTGAVIADVKEMMLLNQEMGFALGDRFLRAVASALSATFPGVPVVRVHTDCFAALFLPSTGVALEASAPDQALQALHRTTEAFRAAEGVPQRPVDFTVSGLRLTVVDPSHWQVLGPLLWAEIERAHVIARRGLASGIEERTLQLDGRVPTPRG